jgi:hypothetical protein
MDYTIHPFEGIGFTWFGMTSEQVHETPREPDRMKPLNFADDSSSQMMSCSNSWRCCRGLGQGEWLDTLVGGW